MKVFTYLCITFMAFGFSQETVSQVDKDTLQVLFVGNSYTFVSNMPHLVSNISEGTEVKLVTSQSTAGGATLKDHWQGKKGLKTRDLIKKYSYDVVVIQGHSMGTIRQKEEFTKYAEELIALAKKNGAQPYLYVTWAREKVPQYQETITSTYRQVAADNNIKIINVGDAWKLARTLRPDIGLFHADGSHPSDLGALLTACVFVAALTGDLPEDISYSQSIQTATGERVVLIWESPLDVIFCQKVALEALQLKE